MTSSPVSVACPSIPGWARRPGAQVESAMIGDAVDLSADQLATAVADAYADVLARAARWDRRPVRFWNFLPGINDPLGKGDETRYMAFNAGRLTALDDHPGAKVATASAIGHTGRDLQIHCLPLVAGDAVAIDNPRQVRPERYSARYGHRPPCFARATRWGSTLFIGGTASVYGEDSVHPDDISRQVIETLVNLSAVLGAAGGRHGLNDLRVYHVPSVAPADVRPLLPPGAAVEFVPAHICRPELLVEIEALALEPR